MADTPSHSLITIPPEISRLVLESLSSSDILALRLVSRDYYSYFTSQDLCHFAQKLYFPLSSEANKAQRTREDFDAAHLRSQRWKDGRPSQVTVINEVATGSASLSNGFLVDSEAGLLAYQRYYYYLFSYPFSFSDSSSFSQYFYSRARAVVVLKNLRCTDDDTVGPDIFIDLERATNPCMGMRSDSIFLRDGESIRLAMNRGMLLCIGEAHVHPVDHAQYGVPTLGKGLTILSTLWNWTWGSQSSPTPPSRAIPPRQFFQHPHTICAVFSTKSHERGKLIASWFERDSFIMEAALNEFYAITEFDLVEQRLEGYVYPTIEPKSSKSGFNMTYNTKPQEGKHEGYHFTIKKKSLYPPLSSFSIAPDTRGKVFYLGFLPPSADRRPIVEVHSVPQYNPNDKSWSPCTVIKRVTLRSLGRHAGEMNGSILNSSFWISLDAGTTVRELKSPKIEPSGVFTRDPDEDIVRIRMTGDLYIPGITKEEEQVNMVTWDITARPSPLPPSTISEWRQGKEWASDLDSEVDLDSISLYKNSEGKVDYEELYPSPTYYSRLRKREDFIRSLVTMPDGVDLDRLVADNKAGILPPLFWVKDDDNKNKSACVVYSVLAPGTLILDPKSDNTDNYGLMSPLPHHEAVIFPQDPGRNDKEFVPAGRLMKPEYKVTLDVGRKVPVRDIAKCLSQPLLPVSQPSPKRRSRFFGKLWTEHIHHHRVSQRAVTATATATATIATVETGEEDSSDLMEGVISTSQTFAEIPLPGMEEHRDKILTKMDHRDKKYWVYGKEPEILHKGQASQERVGDKIVIVRFD